MLSGHRPAGWLSVAAAAVAPESSAAAPTERGLYGRGVMGRDV